MKSIELFAGIGGIALAAEWAGIETIAFCERDPFCQKVLKKHWSDVPIFDDVCTLNRKVLEEQGVIDKDGTVDIISGGYPCQPFSTAGNRKGENDDRHLWPEVKRILQEIRPTWFIGENVAGHITLGLDKVLFDLESIDYSWQPFVIPASAVGAIHRRDRVFIVAHTNSSRFVEYEGQQKEIQRPGQEGIQQEKVGESIMPESLYSIKNDTNTNSDRLQRSIEEKIQGQQRLQRSQTYGSVEEWTRRAYEYQPKLCRSSHGIPNRVDRVKSLGNAVVPQQIYPIFDAIMKISQCY